MPSILASVIAQPGSIWYPAADSLGACIATYNLIMSQLTLPLASRQWRGTCITMQHETLDAPPVDIFVAHN